jgi:hypothetical protein
MPVKIESKWRLDSFPTSSVSSSRSRVIIWEAFATEFLGKPVDRGEVRDANQYLDMQDLCFMRFALGA